MRCDIMQILSLYIIYQAVSYTHLDVYKRQLKKILKLLEQGRLYIKLLRMVVQKLRIPESVSYTHLDVYKRQVKGYTAKPVYIW